MAAADVFGEPAAASAAFGFVVHTTPGLKSQIGQLADDWVGDDEVTGASPVHLDLFMFKCNLLPFFLTLSSRFHLIPFSFRVMKTLNW